LILGTGAAAVAEAFEPNCHVAFGELPHMAPATAVGHPGRFVGGRIGRSRVAILQGRVHLYEGYSPREVQFPVHALAALGVSTLIVTNASGGLNPLYRCGDVVVIEDLVDLTGSRGQGTGNRGRATGDRSQATGDRRQESRDGENSDSTFLPLPLDGGGGRGVGVNGPHKDLLNQHFADAAVHHAQYSDIPVHRGTYIGVLGPNYETRAEYRFLRRIGDIVGMSTLHEVRAARQLGMEVLGLSVVSNECCPDYPLGGALPKKTTGESVVRAVEAAADRLATLISSVCSNL
jgi:purine-nucleoside phosphorylase